MDRLMLVAVALLSVSHAQHIGQLTRFIREQNDLISSTQPTRSQLSGKFFSFDDLLDVVEADRSDVLSPDCKEDLTELISARLGTFNYPEFAGDVWLPIRDSEAKMHGAILKGHLYFAGHFSECVDIDAKLTGRERPFKAGYFKVAVDIKFQPNWMNTSCVVSEMGYISWTLGMCLPKSCSSAELENLFISDSAKHNPVCLIDKTNDSIDDFGVGFYVTISIMGVIVALCLLSALVDFFFSEYVNNKPISKKLPWRIFMSFSLYTNAASIFDTSGSNKSGQIAPIHCIRFFSICWVAVGHLLALWSPIVANPLDVYMITQDLTTEFVANAFFAVDSFFFIGGLLLTFLWFKNHERNPKQTNSVGAWAMLYVHRILRLSPPYYIMVIFYTFVLPQLYRNSPFNMNPMSMLDFCKETWGLEFTYLHNIIEANKPCLGYSWYLATDTQIFLFSPILILPLAFRPLLGFIVAAAIMIASSAINIFLVYHFHWPATEPTIGIQDPEVTNLENYDLYMYNSPIIRCQVYIIGMLVGWFLQSKKRMPINPIINLALWLISIAIMLTVVLGLHSQATGTVTPIFWRAMYSAFSKPAWALALSWMIVSCYYGYGGPINSFMSWHVWVPLGRLSYCAYLVHYPMILIILAQTHDELYYSSFINFVITFFVPLIALTFLVSMFWSACFEISFGRMEMLLLGGFRMKEAKEKVEPPISRKQSKSDIDGLEDARI